MSQYKHPAMKQFADQQVRFAPLERKLRQLARAEGLLATIDPKKQYPYQFVVFRITEVRPEMYPDLVLSGQELAHDLRLWMEEMSASAPIPVGDAGELVLTVEDLSKRYSISTKTVNRWRERGLVGRRFLMGGRKRVGFLKSSVDRFVGEHAAEVDRGTRFTQLTENERDEILRWARSLSVSPTATLAEVSRRIASKLGRSQETVRYTIRNFDQEHPDQAIFPDLRGPLDENAKQAIYRMYRRGISIDALARRYGRTRSSIYRVVNEVRAKSLFEKPVEFMNHPSFTTTNVLEKMLAEAEPVPARRPAATKPPAGLPPYLQNLYEIPLLTREEEQFLFRKMNVLLSLADRLRKEIEAEPNHIRSNDLDQYEKWLEEAQEVKRRLIRSNLRLVVSIAKRHVTSAGTNLFELISDGNISLMRAVEKFDFGRGFKFSTYASWAIMKNFARSIPAENNRRDRFLTGQDLAFELKADDRSNESEVEQSQKRMHSAVERILNRLDEREREIIIDRYGLSDRARSQTLEQVGNKFGVTKERIRQIEARAIRKLKDFAKEENLDLSLLAGEK